MLSQVAHVLGGACSRHDPQESVLQALVREGMLCFILLYSLSNNRGVLVDEHTLLNPAHTDLRRSHLYPL